MPATYQPDTGVEPDASWAIAFLSQRDLSIQIPVNYVTHPGVSLSKACFGKDVYEDGAASRCISNLLATRFQRFLLDLYWDSGRKVWSFCPVQLSNSSSNQSPSSTTSSILSTSNSGSTSTSASLSPRDGQRGLKSVAARQNSASTTSGVSPGASGIESAHVSTTSSAASASTSPRPSSQPLVQVGKYMCTETIDLPVYTGVLADFIKRTSTNLDVVATYTILNLHVAALNGSTSTTPPSLDPANLPVPLSTIFNANLTNYLYTPVMLKDDRANLNSSWLNNAANNRPDLSYISGKLNPQNQLTTESGWPSESLIEFSKRLIVGIGQVDAQLALYNTTRDFEFYFRSQDLTAPRDVSYDSSGTLSSGCFINTTNPSSSASDNSWAVSSDFGTITLPTNSNTSIPSISNVTACGITPILNETLLGDTADKQPAPYKSFAYSSIWSWAPGQPRNVSSTETNNHIRCAAMDTSLDGRWRVTDCTEHHYGACRVGSDPYKWRISSSRGTYSSRDQDCPKGSSFAFPRTGLENRYLFSMLSRNADASSDGAVWLNFNSLDRQNCWVAGVNSTCPYSPVNNDKSHRTVVVPTVAAVIVFVIAALTVFVKCASNRQNYTRARRRKATDEGGDYEGVPS